MEHTKHPKAQLRLMTHNVWNGPHHGRDTAYPVFYESYRPDVLCLQEMVPHMYDSALPGGLTEHYDFLQPDTQGLTNVTPILVRKGVFTVVEQGYHLFTGLNDGDSKSVSWAVLEYAGGRRIGICGNHFWWEESLESDLAREEDARQMQAYVDYMRVTYSVPVFTMGDFNCTMDSRAYGAMVSAGAMDCRLRATEGRDFGNTLHEYPTLNEEKGCYENGPAPVGTQLDAIDHILVYGGETVDVLTQKVVTDQAVLDLSDHCPVYVDICLR